jgi:zinc protease
MKDYKGGKSMAQGEFFDPSIENIEKKVSTGKISDNVNFAFLPRKTRNEVVNILLNIHYGNESALTGKNTPASLMPSLLTRGTKNKSRQQLEDALAGLKAQWRATGSVGEIQVSVVCQRESVAKVMDLLQEVLREPSFPVEEFEIIKRQSKDLLEKSKTEPGALASRLLQRKLDPQPESNIRYIPTVEESMSRLEKTSIEDIRNLYSSTVGVGEAELVAVGDFDPAILQEKAKSILANWKAGVPYARIERSAKTTTKGEKVIIETPDKENAMFLTGFAFGMKDTDPDFAALEVADFILGGGTLSSRLGNRVRQKEGLAYGIRSFFNSEALDNSSRFQVMASCNPTKVANVDKAVFEELKLLIEKGIDPKEFSESQKALLAQWKIERSSDSRIAGILAENLSAKRDMDFYRKLEKQVETLTPQQVVDAFKKHIDPDKMITIWAGDFKKAK